MKYLILSYRFLSRYVVVLAINVAVMNQVSLAREASSPAIIPGIYFSQQKEFQLSAQEKSKLTASLRRLTGWQQLRIDERNSLILERTTEFVGGSVWARRIITEVFRSGNRFVVENHSSSATVNFGQLDEGTAYADPHVNIKFYIFRLRLDFDDFKKMQADPAVRDTFDEGFTFFHELLHGLGLQDTEIHNEIGDCERVVNQIRADLGLPLRDQYLGDLLRITPQFKTLRLRFKSPASAGKATTRWRKHYLFFVFNTEQEWEFHQQVTRPLRESNTKLFTSLDE